MNMFWHEHEGNQSEFFVVACLVDRTCQNSTPGIIREKWLSPVAGERQLVKMPQAFDMPDSLPVRLVAHWVDQPLRALAEPVAQCACEGV